MIYLLALCWFLHHDRLGWAAIALVALLLTTDYGQITRNTAALWPL